MPTFCPNDVLGRVFYNKYTEISEGRFSSWNTASIISIDKRDPSVWGAFVARGSVSSGKTESCIERPIIQNIEVNFEGAKKYWWMKKREWFTCQGDRGWRHDHRHYEGKEH